MVRKERNVRKKNKNWSVQLGNCGKRKEKEEDLREGVKK